MLYKYNFYLLFVNDMKMGIYALTFYMKIVAG